MLNQAGRGWPHALGRPVRRPRRTAHGAGPPAYGHRRTALPRPDRGRGGHRQEPPGRRTARHARPGRRPAGSWASASSSRNRCRCRRCSTRSGRAEAELARSRPVNPVIGALAPLLPEIAEHLPPPLPPLPDQRAERHRVFRAAVALLDHLSPLVLVLEDVHWADSGTHDFLAFLAAHLPENLTVILTVRTESGLLPIREAFARAPSGPARSVSLAPLTMPEVEELARSILKADLPPCVRRPLRTRRRAASRSSWRRCSAHCWNACPRARSPAAPTSWPTSPCRPCYVTSCCSGCPPSTTRRGRSSGPPPSSA